MSSDIFISEYYNIGWDKDLNPSGNNQDKAIELYNCSNIDVALEGYSINCYGKGGNLQSSFNLEGTIKSMSTFVIINEYTEDEHLIDVCDQIEKVFIGAKSAVTLLFDNEVIDTFGEVGKTYTTNDDYVINGTISACDNKTVIRNPLTKGNSIFKDSDWTVLESWSSASVGVHNYDGKKDDTSIDEAMAYIKNKYDGAQYDGDIDLLFEYEGYHIEYDFWGSPYYDNEGHFLSAPSEYAKDISFWITITGNDETLEDYATIEYVGEYSTGE